mmetsp:Transcript_29016/g.67512  ORF Transcript_29016/g.67512 Transcript_29016/m.67512 type:complete len:220 (-) Transcript_29016:788-1447(-)
MLLQLLHAYEAIPIAVQRIEGKLRKALSIAMCRKKASGHKLCEAQPCVVVQVARAEHLFDVDLLNLAAPPPAIQLYLSQGRLQVGVGDEAVAVTVGTQERMAQGLDVGAAHARSDAVEAATHDRGRVGKVRKAPGNILGELPAGRTVGLEPPVIQCLARAEPCHWIHLQQRSDEVLRLPASAFPRGFGLALEVLLQLSEPRTRANAPLKRPGELQLPNQ